MDAIVAVYSDWGIGAGGTQPVVLHADRAHFRALTDGAAVIVGRATLADFPGGRPLKGRRNGGESVYRQLLPYTNRVYVTRIELAPHSTAFFPDLDAAPEWVCTDPGVPLSEDGVAYRFCTYERVLDKE